MARCAKEMNVVHIKTHEVLRLIDSIMNAPRTPERLSAIDKIGARVAKILECEWHEVTIFDARRR